MLATVGLASCAEPEATSPTVAVTDVHLMEVGFPKQLLAGTLCVTNSNGIALDTRRVTTTLDVAGSELLSGANDAPVHLAPRSSTLVPFSVSTTVENLGPQLLAVSPSGEIAYRLHGTVAIDQLGGIALPYGKSGRLAALTFGLQAATSFYDADPTPNACSDR